MSQPAPFRKMTRQRPVAWAEILFLAPLGLALAMVLDRHAPFTFSSFPWLWLIPFLLGLRYGLGAAAISGIVLTGAGFGMHWFDAGVQPPPLTQVVGGLFLALSAGQFSSNWREKLQANRLRTSYAEERLESLTRAYFINRLSHDRLEEALITQPVTLRDALEKSRELSADAGTVIDKANASDLLQLLAQYCRFEAAALHVLERDRLSDRPIAALGPEVPLASEDPLLVHAREHAQAAFYSIDQLHELESGGQYRAAFPLRNAGGEELGMLVVRDMPMLALNEENLTAATAILQYFADESWAIAQSATLRGHYPSCPPRFAHELIKLQHLHVVSRVRSMLVAVRIPVPSPDQPLDAHAIHVNIRRSLDVYWLDPFASGSPGILALLPLSGPAGARGYLDRLDAWLREQGVASGLETHGFGTSLIAVDMRPPDALLAACGIAGAKDDARS